MSAACVKIACGGGRDVAGAEELDVMIRKLRELPGLVKRAAPDVADAVKASIERTIEAGTTSDGKAWAPRKADGGRPLEGAEKALAVAAVGTRVYARLSGHVARHHLGRAKGGTYREILPTTSKLPAPMADGIRRELVRHFDDAMRGV